MLTNFQQSKLELRFGQLDALRDGYLDKRDLEVTAQRLCDELLPADSADQRRAVYDSHRYLWGMLVPLADHDGDHRISLQEYVQALEAHVVGNPQGYQLCVARTMKALFDAMDGNGDGCLDRAEVSKMATTLGVAESDVDIMFDKLDANRDGVISEAEYLAALHDFYHGDDPDSAGSYLFGRVSMETAPDQKNP
ncbi:hypothetical protein D5S17_24210 [Pseudonocardiaceae bacterium YIM PH 21723]|nr:hypothetical protein D5S17_24210 [Pseudonocardiaceae bacterium YIM PH 21723]